MNERMVCILVFQEMSDFLSTMQYSVTDLRVPLHLAQSASQYACNWIGLLDGMEIHGVCLIYLKTRYAAS